MQLVSIYRYIFSASTNTQAPSLTGAATNQPTQPNANDWSREQIDQHLRAESIIDLANCSVALEIEFAKIPPGKAIAIYESKLVDKQKVELAKIAHHFDERSLTELINNLQSEVTLDLESPTIDTILSIGIHSPVLATRLAQLANNPNLKRETVEWVCHAATFDLNLLDAYGPTFKRRNELPINLAFSPALHLNFSKIERYISSKK